MVTASAERTTRKLTAAEGYLELGLPELALEELQTVENPGPFIVPHLWITGEALKAQGRYDEAIALLRHVANSLPKPASQQVWQSLTECLQESGRQASAEPLAATLEKSRNLQETTATDVRTQTFDLTIPHIGKLTLNLQPGTSLKLSIETGN
mgnify:CR=1 FL=1